MALFLVYILTSSNSLCHIKSVSSTSGQNANPNRLDTLRVRDVAKQQLSGEGGARVVVCMQSQRGLLHVGKSIRQLLNSYLTVSTCTVLLP